MNTSKVSQSVKEVLQGLVDDGLVQGDKIGSSNCLSFGPINILCAKIFCSLLELSVRTWRYGKAAHTYLSNMRNHLLIML